MSPVVSIVSAHFNRADLLRETLDSLRSQTFSDWEAIVVDDGSEDRQRSQIHELAKADSRIRIIERQEEPKGPNKCRNLGLAAATGKYVMFLDSDDVLAPWALEQRVEAMVADEQVDLAVFHAMVFEETPGDQNRLWNRLNEANDDLERFICETPPWCLTSTIWQTTSARSIGGLDESLWYGTDSELHTRALLAGLRYRKFPEARPDMFVRRDATPRFNSTLSPRLFQAKLNRLQAGLDLIEKHDSPEEFRNNWERRYFEELEFLLFNVSDNREPISQLLQVWQENYRPGFFLKVLVRGYALVARVTKDRAYLLLRIARRMTLTLLPKRFWPVESDRYFESESLADDRFQSIVDALKTSDT